MLITGYDVGPLVPGEPLLLHPGFWSNYLLAMCSDGGCAERPVPEWFGEDGADADALSEVLLDPEHWPVFRMPAEDGPGAVVIYRNLDGDYGTDYLLTHPDRSYAQQIASWDGDFSGTGLTWHELIRIADSPFLTDEGVQDTATRFLLPASPPHRPGRAGHSISKADRRPDRSRRAARHSLPRGGAPAGAPCEEIRT